MSIERLPPRPVRALLEELEALTRSGSKVPSLTVHLLGGQTLRGRFIAHDRGSLVLHTDDTRGALDAAYVSVESVAALVVHHTQQTLHLLSGGRIAPVPLDVPGRLVIQRRADALKLGEIVGRAIQLTVDWAAIGTADVARAAVLETLELLPAALSGVAADAIGREALGAVAEIVVTVGEYGGVEREGERLRVVMRREGEQTFAMKELERALSGAL